MIFSGSYWRTNLIICAVNVLLAIGLDFVLGYAGQLNLGQSAFAGIGAYASTLLITRLGVPFWIAFACGVLLAGLAGMLLSIFAVRLRGHYLAIASLGFAVITYQVLLNWISLTQGPLGIYGIAPPPPLTIPGLPSISFSNTANFFYLTGGFALLTYILLDQLVRSPVGETLAAIREDEVLGRFAGDQLPEMEGICLYLSVRRLRARVAASARAFIGTLVPDAFFITRSFSIPGDGHRRRHQERPDRPSRGRDTADAGAAGRAATRHRRPSLPYRIRRLYHASRAVHAQGHRLQAVRLIAALLRRRFANRPHGAESMIVATPSAVGTSAQGAGDDILFQRPIAYKKHFGGVQALRDITGITLPHAATANFHADGIVFAVIGPNGAGKSTLHSTP